MSSDRQLRVGIVGAGRMGITHHAIIGSHPNVNVTCIAEPSSVMAGMLEKYVKVRSYRDHVAMLSKEDLDAVLVCTPPAMNRAIIELALDRRLHVFVEKPFVLSAEDGAAMAERFTAAGLVNQVGYVNRFNDAFCRLRELLADRLIGPVIRFRSEMFSRTIVREQEESGWRASHAQGGGALFEMASHAIDLINYLFGPPDKVAGSWLSEVFSKSVEDIVSCSLLYRDGRSGQLYVNWSDESYRKPTNKIEVFGRDGRVMADQHGLKIHLTRASEKHGFKAGWNILNITDIFRPVPFYVRGMEFTSQLYHFVDCALNGNAAQNRCSFEDGTRTLSIIEQIVNDFASNKKGLA